MPNINRHQTVYIPQGNPDAVNAESLYREGELGVTYDYNDRAYQVVKLDSGVAVAPVAGMVTFWKDKTVHLVTVDSAQAIGGSTTNAFRNQVAGILRVAATPGRYVHILKRGRFINVASDGTGGVGQIAVALDGVLGRVTPTAVGTAPSYIPIGVMRAAASADFIRVDVDIPDIP